MDPNDDTTRDDAPQAEGPRQIIIPALYPEDVERMVARVLDQRLQALEARLVSQLTDLARPDGLETRSLAMLTEREMAELIGCDPRTIRRLEKSGTIPPAVRIGGSKRWFRSDIEEWIAELRAPQGRKRDNTDRGTMS